VEPYPDALLPAAGTDAAALFDQRESVRLAFLVALQHLPARQRAVLLLRDVLGWKASEVASLLELSVSSVNSALYRARVTLSARRRDESRGVWGVRTSSATEQRLLDRYLQAWEMANIEGLTSLLKEDASFPMPPLPGWYRGREAIRVFLLRTVLQGDARGRWRLVPTRANGLPAFGLYRKQEDGHGHAAFGIQVVTIEAGLVADVTTFGFPTLCRSFGLPETV
jgi:RNA polymerase sigma-70 factor (ECF subfamily)